MEQKQQMRKEQSRRHTAFTQAMAMQEAAAAEAPSPPRRPQAPGAAGRAATAAPAAAAVAESGAPIQIKVLLGDAKSLTFRIRTVSERSGRDSSLGGVACLRLSARCARTQTHPFAKVVTALEKRFKWPTGAVHLEFDGDRIDPTKVLRAGKSQPSGSWQRANGRAVLQPRPPQCPADLEMEDEDQLEAVGPAALLSAVTLLSWRRCD
jgi:hypothetical protein